MVPETIVVVAGAASFSTRDVWEGYRRGLTAMGHEVVPYPTFSILKILSHNLTGNDLVGKALDIRNRINVAIFVDGLYFQGDRAWVPATLRKHGVLTVLIKTDDPYTPVPQAEDFFDLIVTNELAQLEAGEVYLPTATESPPLDLVIPVEKTIDLCFIGTLFDDRLPLIRQLAQHCEQSGIRFSLQGHLPADLKDLESMQSVTVSRKPVAAEKKWRTYANSHAVLNLFREGEGAVSPSPRVFEVTAIGGPALLTGSRRNEVTRIFGDSVFHYDGFDELVAQLTRVLNDQAARESAVKAAREITLGGHLYRHRCQSLMTHVRARLAARADSIRVTTQSDEGSVADQTTPRSLDRQLAWIIGCGRTGSTWLCEMLNDVPQVNAWHEPYFGRFFKHVYDEPHERERATSFFADRDRSVWYGALRQMFFEMAEQRYPALRQQALFVKEVNTPEFFNSIRDCFPGSSIILLQRDPFDVLDSYLAMVQPGSWNRRAAREWAHGPQQAARHIAKCFSVAHQAYDAAPQDRRLCLRYEELLDRTADGIRRCCALTGSQSDEDTLQGIVDRHRFSNQSETGPRAFRRFGKAGTWRQSGQFTAEVLQIADAELGTLRAKMGYTDTV